MDEGKVINFYSYLPMGFDNFADGKISTMTCYSWNDTKYAISNDYKTIHTIQMGMMSMDLITDHGYRIFVHEFGDESYEIDCGDTCARTDRELRPVRDIFKMWKAGAFNVQQP